MDGKTAEVFLAELGEIVHAFETVRERCDALLMSGASLDAQGCYEARQRVFERLQRLMEEWHGNRELNARGDVKEVLQRELRKLMDGEKILEQHAGEARWQVQEELAALRRGKKSLSSYRSGNGKTRQPRFLSNRT